MTTTEDSVEEQRKRPLGETEADEDATGGADTQVEPASKRERLDDESTAPPASSETGTSQATSALAASVAAPAAGVAAVPVAGVIPGVVPAVIPGAVPGMIPGMVPAGYPVGVAPIVFPGAYPPGAVPYGMPRTFVPGMPGVPAYGALPVPAPAPFPLPTLTDEQKQAVEAAKAYAKEATAKINEKMNAHLAALQSANVARNLAMMGRLYVGSVSFDLTPADVKTVFQQFGAVRDVSMTVDPNTGRHKGFCFVEYESPEGATLALEILKNYTVGGRTLKVSRPNNYTVNPSVGMPPPPKNRLYVANVHEMLGEKELASVFNNLGTVTKCVLVPDVVTRKHKGYGFVEFEDESKIEKAIAVLHGMDMGGLKMMVTHAAVGVPLPAGMSSLDNLPPPPPGSAVPAPAKPISLLMSSQPSASANAVDIAVGVSGTLDQLMRAKKPEESIEDNISIKGSERMEVMKKLSRQQIVSTVMVLKNMVSAEDVDEELQEDVTQECSNYGEVDKVIIYQEREHEDDPNPIVKIFVQYTAASSAEKAVSVMNGRWFAGKKIQAEIYDEKLFNEQDLSG